MERLAKLGRGALISVMAIAVGALVIVGLLTGACSSSRPRGHCFRPGVCYDTTSSGDYVYECGAGDHFEEGPCTGLMRVGACVMPPNEANHRVYLYAPLHGVLPPDCERLAGLGSHFVRE